MSRRQKRIMVNGGAMTLWYGKQIVVFLCLFTYFLRSPPVVRYRTFSLDPFVKLQFIVEKGQPVIRIRKWDEKIHNTIDTFHLASYAVHLCVCPVPVCPVYIPSSVRMTESHTTQNHMQPL